jgi:DNA polymerase elongation subunit (family B)
MKLPLPFPHSDTIPHSDAIPLLYPPPFQYTRQLIQESPFNDSLSCSGMCSVENSKKEMWERSCDSFGEAQCTFETDSFPAEYILDRSWVNN